MTILNNRKRIRKLNKKTLGITINQKLFNHKEINKKTIIKSIIIGDYEYPTNNKIITIGTSKTMIIPAYLINNQLLKKGDLIEKIRI